MPTKPKPQPKTATTTEYGTFNAYAGDLASPTIEYGITAALDDYAHEFDIQAIADEYRAAVNQHLPEGVTLTGDSLTGPAPFDYQLSETIPAAFAAADDQFIAIAEKHLKTTT